MSKVSFDSNSTSVLVRTAFFCRDGILTDWYSAQTIYLSPGPADRGQLIYTNSGINLTTYAHSIDGQYQGGVYYGAGGSTTWAFRKPSSGDQEFYLARLLQSGETSEDCEVEGFLEGTIP